MDAQVQARVSNLRRKRLLLREAALIMKGDDRTYIALMDRSRQMQDDIERLEGGP